MISYMYFIISLMHYIDVLITTLRTARLGD